MVQVTGNTGTTTNTCMCGCYGHYAAGITFTSTSSLTAEQKLGLLDILMRNSYSIEKMSTDVKLEIEKKVKQLIAELN